MGNEQSGAQGQAMPEAGLRLSTLCRYQAESGSEEGLASFKWFNPSTDVSGLVLKGAHRWGYVLSHAGGQRLFKDMRQRFFVLLDHYLCYFEHHGQEARMRGSVDLDKTHCQLELLPRPPDRVVVGTNGIATAAEDTDGEEHHRVEVTRKSDEWSMVLCFTSAGELQSWMKSIFDVQQRKATFSPLRHGYDTISGSDRSSAPGSSRVSGAPKERDVIAPQDSSFSPSTGVTRRSYRDFSVTDDDRETDDDEWVRVRTGTSSPSGGSVRLRGNRRISGTNTRDGRLGSENNSAGDGVDGRSGRRRSGRRRGGGRRNRGTLYPPPTDLSSRGSVPLSWADSKQSCEDRSFQMAERLGKASERLAGLPRGGRAPGSDGMNSSLDEYGAYTTAHASIYEGWTRGLQAHGWGRMLCAQGDCVEGWWEHDVLEGTGEHRSVEEGWTYRGGFVAGERHGPGRLEIADGDVWECEWRHGVVASGVSGTHHTSPPNGEVYQGGCAPSSGNPKVPCRAGHGKLKRKDGEQVETHFRAGKAVDGAKGVVRFRNGAIFFGQLQDARPNGYGELYLSSVKPLGRNSHSNRAGGSSAPALSPLAELDEMAEDILWYKGDFSRGKPHGYGLVKYKEPPFRPLSSSSAARSSRRPIPRAASVPDGPHGQGASNSLRHTLRSNAGVIPTNNSDLGSGGHNAIRSDRLGRDGGNTTSATSVSPGDQATAAVRASSPTNSIWGESKEEEVDESASGINVGVGGSSGGSVVQVMEDGDEEEDDELDHGQEDEEDEDDDGGEEGDSSDSEEEEEEEEEEEIVRRRRRRNSVGGDVDGGEEKATARTPRHGQGPPNKGSGGAAGAGGRGADMEYEAEFENGVMKRQDTSQLRLAALRFGRAEIRRLETLLRREEEAMVRMHSRNLCLLCNTEEMNALLVGCRHRVLCMGCAGRTDACPVCRERIGKVVKTYST